MNVELDLGKWHWWSWCNSSVVWTMTEWDWTSCGEWNLTCFAHLHKQIKQHHVFKLKVQSAQPQSALLSIIFKNSRAMCFLCTTVVLGQLAGLSKEAFCAHGCWLVQRISQSEGGERSISLKVSCLPAVVDEIQTTAEKPSSLSHTSIKCHKFDNKIIPELRIKLKKKERRACLLMWCVMCGKEKRWCNTGQSKS